MGYEGPQNSQREAFFHWANFWTLHKYLNIAQIWELCGNAWALRKFRNLLFANFWTLHKFLNIAQISELCANFWILRKFLNFVQISELCANFWTLRKFLNFGQITGGPFQQPLNTVAPDSGPHTLLRPSRRRREGLRSITAWEVLRPEKYYRVYQQSLYNLCKCQQSFHLK